MNQDNVIESFKTVIDELESGIAENNERCAQFAQQGNYTEVAQLAESGQKLKHFQQKVDQLRQEWLVYLGKIDSPAPYSGLRVRFPNGKVINQSTSADTFALAIQEIGLEKVRLLKKKVCKVPLIASQKHEKYSQKQVGSYYIFTHDKTLKKKELLEEISKALQIEITVEIVE